MSEAKCNKSPCASFGKWFSWAGVAVVAGGLYFMLFWALPMAAFSSPLALSRPEAMGCTFAEFVTRFHLLFACIIWGSWGMGRLDKKYKES